MSRAPRCGSRSRSRTSSASGCGRGGASGPASTSGHGDARGGCRAGRVRSPSRGGSRERYLRDVSPIDRAAAPPTVRLAEVLVAVSLASDVGHDQPLEKSLRNAVIATRLGDELGLRGQELSSVYYVALLRSMGCTANSHEAAMLFGGEDRAFLGLVQELAGGDPGEWARRAHEL